MPCDYKKYPKNWKWIRAAILRRASDKCEFCGIQNYTVRNNGSKVVLTIANIVMPEILPTDSLETLSQNFGKTE